jgi:ankyrin repeat protein
MPLARAARNGHVALVALYLGRGAAVDARNLFGATALYVAAENERTSTVALLLGKGADPNLPGRSGVTPLAAAAFKGNDRIVGELIARKADPDAMDTTGKSPITYAAARGFALVVRRLLDAGVDVKRAYGNDLTALMWAAGHEDGVGERATLDVVTLLLDSGAPIDAVDNRGRTALMIAAELGRAAIVEALLARGADRAIADKAGKRAADLAANDSVREKLSAR